MKRIKNLALIIPLLLVTAFVFAGCGSKAVKPKTFTRHGISITADTSFRIVPVIGTTIALHSPNITITGTREPQIPQLPMSLSLREYTQMILMLNGLSVPIHVHENGFEYFFFEAAQGLISNTTMGVTMKSSTAFYLFNFVCNTANFESFQERFLTWAELIVVT